MELQFDTKQCAYLKQIVSQAQKQEQTQELRLTEDMPDIGRILGCWGQIMIRSKEWRQNEIGAAGGIKASVLYVGEDGQSVQCMDAWLPFQLRWPIPDTQHDGQIQLQPYIQELECRGIGARKMMLRASVCVHARAYEPSAEQIAAPPVLPEQLYIRKRIYPLELPMEAGEKPFAIDDDFVLPEGAADVDKIVLFEVFPQLREQKVMTGKVVFRGGYLVKLLYLCPEGRLHSWQGEGAFSQFSDLDKDYSIGATVNASILQTLAELDVDEQGGLHLKCGMAYQYVIFDRVSIEVADDAYCAHRQIKLHMAQLDLPVRLDEQSLSIPYSAQMAVDARKIIDSSILWAMPLISADERRSNVLLEGKGQLLYLDEQGLLQSAAFSPKEEWSQFSDPMNRLELTVQHGPSEAEMDGDGVGVNGRLQMELSVGAARGIPMLTAIEIGEPIPEDPDRPSVILRRVGSDSLWDIAKAYGSTVERISQANGLESEPAADKMLLIPVN